MTLIAVALGFAYFRTGEKGLAGVSVAGVSASGRDAAELGEALRQFASRSRDQPLRLVLAARASSLPSSAFGAFVDVDATARRALAVGRSGSIGADFARYVRSLWSHEEVAAVLRVDERQLQSALDRVERELIAEPPAAAGIDVNSAPPRATPPRAGLRILRKQARLAVIDAIARGRTSAELKAERVTPVVNEAALGRALELLRLALAGPLRLKAGERELTITPGELRELVIVDREAPEVKLELDAIRLETWLAPRRVSLEAPPRDATFEVSHKEEISILPAEPGVRLALEDIAVALWRAAESADRTGELPLRREPAPARSTEQAEKLGIRRLVSSFTTRHPCCQRRVENIHRIASLMNGLIVEAGQTVSVNEVVGPRTQKNGFVLAPGIEDGEMVDTIGGGVSQFATTFFNALLHAGYDIIERQPHSYWFPRYPMGHEATLSWPKPDIVFRNDSAAGLLVKTSYTEKSITVKLYGDTGGRKVTSSVSERRDIVRPRVELLPNREVPPDKEKVQDAGMIGWTVLASRTITFADGTKKEERRKVTYKPKPKRVEVHPCRIPEGEPGATGERCPEPEQADESEDASLHVQSE